MWPVDFFFHSIGILSIISIQSGTSEEFWFVLNPLVLIRRRIGPRQKPSESFVATSRVR